VEDGFRGWSARPVAKRADVLRKLADKYEEIITVLTSITTRKAGKAILDGIAEVREAADVLHCYANTAERLEEEDPGKECGIFLCISPLNFPITIFS